MTVKAIVFDMDGLMIDTESLYWEAARKLARQHGTRVTDDTLRRMMGRSMMDSVRLFALECSISAPPETLHEQRKQLMLDRYAMGVESMPGLHDILNRFRGRTKLGIATSSPRQFIDVLLPSVGVMEYFDAIQGGDDIFNGKPDPEIYLKTIARLLVEPSQCVVLEDSHAGALAGYRAGAHVIVIPTALTANEDFPFAHARAASLFDAIPLIEQIH